MWFFWTSFCLLHSSHLLFSTSYEVAPRSDSEDESGSEYDDVSNDFILTQILNASQIPTREFVCEAMAAMWSQGSLLQGQRVFFLLPSASTSFQGVWGAPKMPLLVSPSLLSNFKKDWKPLSDFDWKLEVVFKCTMYDLVLFPYLCILLVMSLKFLC